MKQAFYIILMFSTLGKWLLKYSLENPNWFFYESCPLEPFIFKSVENTTVQAGQWKESGGIPGKYIHLKRVHLHRALKFVTLLPACECTSASSNHIMTRVKTTFLNED